MILTVTLNPCLHRIVSFSGDPGRRVIRPVEGTFQVGGKGVNVARAARRMGAEPLALLTAGGALGRVMCDALTAEGIAFEAVPVAAETRMSTIVLSRDDDGFREYLEAGHDVSAGEAQSLRARFLELLPAAAMVTVNGSVAAAGLEEFPAFAVSAARRAGVPVLVDTYGPPAPLAAEAGPDLLKANLDEVRSSFGVAVSSLAGARDFAESLLARGVGAVVLTDGAEGAIVITREGGHAITPPATREVHPVGCGDAMLGAMAAAMTAGSGLLDAVVLGAAAGAVNASRPGVGDVDADEVRTLARRVVARPLPAAARR